MRLLISIRRRPVVGFLSIRLRIWGSGVRISSGAPASSLSAQLFCPARRGAASTPGAPWKRGGIRNGLCTSIRSLPQPMPPTAIGAAGPATSSARESLRSCGRRSTRRRYSRLPAARMRHIPMPPSSISHGSCQGAAEPPRLVLVARRRAAQCFQPLASYKIANNYRGFMTNDKLVADLRKSFEGYAGPPANKGGVRLAC